MLYLLFCSNSIPVRSCISYSSLEETGAKVSKFKLIIVKTGVYPFHKGCMISFHLLLIKCLTYSAMAF